MIDSKEKNFDAYKKGLFGNKLRTWYGLYDFNNSDYSGYVTLRYSGDVGASNYTAYNVLKVNDKVNEFIIKSINKNIKENPKKNNSLYTLKNALTNNLNSIIPLTEIYKNYSKYKLFYVWENINNVISYFD